MKWGSRAPTPSWRGSVGPAFPKAQWLGSHSRRVSTPGGVLRIPMPLLAAAPGTPTISQAAVPQCQTRFHTLGDHVCAEDTAQPVPSVASTDHGTPHTHIMSRYVCHVFPSSHLCPGLLLPLVLAVWF